MKAYSKNKSRRLPQNEAYRWRDLFLKFAPVCKTGGAIRLIINVSIH